MRYVVLADGSEFVADRTSVMADGSLYVWAGGRGSRPTAWYSRREWAYVAESGAVIAMARSMADTKEERVEWLWKGRFPRGGLVIVDGDPEMGKTTVMLDVCARASSGAQLPDGSSITPCRCLIGSTEDRPSTRMQPLLRFAGAAPGNIFWLDAPEDKHGRWRPFSIPDDIEYIEGEIADTEADIVLLDPMMGFVSEGIRTGDDASIRRMLTPLAQLAEIYNCCIILIRHLKKDQREKNPLYRGGGSIGIIGQARVGLLVGRPPDAGEWSGERVIAVAKLNLLDKRLIPSLKFELEPSDEDPDYPVVKWRGNCAVTAKQLLVVEDARSNAPARKEAFSVLVEVLSQGPRKMKDVFEEADGAGVNKDTLKNAMRAGAGTTFHKWAERRANGSIACWWLHLVSDGRVKDCAVCAEGHVVTRQD